MSSKVKCSHILVKKLSEAEGVIARLDGGEKFATVARAVSIDGGSARRGGDLGWFGRGAMVKEFEREAFSLPVGGTSGPVRSQFGYHVIRRTG
ncbi:MAG: peptidyl-prolyl cis-trans isomerase [Nitrosopumilus sp.]|nr:peptidyl-prolyl cis-trans isomerase [Nitrosopumilus sp.]MDA7943244.1 peptidyl-prolyl cis-trans isomerase [Nitrosopumilus sp.]MDA7952359.1 peptidyl-prolyl cis-trans isomerase [Nitrosopumilus sp.]MDA7959644.1 peptidyl-prolyl cis-trans isomerase [Nitrosopumilus sp.]MDA7998667.1 peptidyl-prolyl cis-trans isomerase [Nitrosopumilus sp.]